MKFDEVLAYYPANSGTVLCVDCAQEKFTEAELNDSDKFSVAFPSTEIGAPPTCDDCNEIIAGLSPTNETCNYMKEQAASHPEMVTVLDRYKADEWTGFEYEAVTFGMENAQGDGYYIAGYRYTGTPDTIQWDDEVYSERTDSVFEAENAAEHACSQDKENQEEEERARLAEEQEED